jgi:hypothetical protein
MSKGCAFCRGVFSDCWQVTCDRCGKAGCSNTHVPEEGDEWECGACNRRENEGEQTCEKKI